VRLGVLTVSDRSSRGERDDRSGPLLRDMAEAQGWQVVRTAIVPDDMEDIRQTLTDWSDSGEVDLILTSGGTGFSPRDQTPEATRSVIEREAPGLAEAMRSAGLRHTPHAMLSRAVAGIRGKTLIINLPGSPKGARESLDVVLPVLGHALALLRESSEAELGHTPRALGRT
jgi:molybdopterin adenylyltransferase